MKVFVLGHSGTAGHGVESLEQTWPAMLEARLRARGIPAEVTTVNLFPAGDRAIDYALRKADEAAAAVVLLSVNAFPCVVPIVAASVRRRFGERAHGLYLQLERGFERTKPGQAAAANQFARRVARGILGAEPRATVEEVGRVYVAILRELARRERLEVIAIAESRMAPEVNRRLPGMAGHVARLHGMVRPEVEAHRFLWLDAEDAMVGPDTSIYYQADGVHSSPLAAQRYAEHLERALCSLGEARPLEQ